MLSSLSNSTIHHSFKKMTEGVVSGKKFSVVTKVDATVNLSDALFLQSWFNRDLAGVDKQTALKQTAKRLVQISTQKHKLKVFYIIYLPILVLAMLIIIKLQVILKIHLLTLGTVVAALEKEIESTIGSELAPNVALKKKKELVNIKLMETVCSDDQFKDLRVLNIIPTALLTEKDDQKRALAFRR